MKKMTLWGRITAYVLQALLILIIFLPLLFAFVSSLRPLEDVYRYIRPISWQTFFPSNVTWEAYRSIFADYGFGMAVGNSLLVAAATIVLGVTFNAMAGFCFAKFRFAGKGALFVIVMVTAMVPFELISINLYQVIMGFGWVNSYQALILPSVANGIVIFLFRQFFLDFPNYMIESAMLDGLSWPGIFGRIAMPNAKSIAISAGLILFLSQWESFMWPVLVTRTPDMRTVQVALNSFRTEHAKLWHLIFAASIVAFLIPVLIMMPLQRYYVEGIVSSGVKE